MTIWQAIVSFSIAAGLLTITPGLDTALVLRTATVKGPWPAFAVALGTAVGCLIWCVLVSVGLGALLLLSQTIYDVLHFAGACYLLYLGVQMILKARNQGLPSDVGDGDASLSQTLREDSRNLKHWFVQGLLNNLLNPKVGVFYVTFLPQFIPPGVQIAAFGLLLGAIHAVVGLSWYSLLTLATRPFAVWLKHPKMLQRLDRLTGSFLMLFGLKLVLEPRHAR